MTSLQEAVDDILELGNKDGGWNISGWTERGTSTDVGVERQPRPINLPLSKRWMQVSWATILPPLASIDINIYRCWTISNLMRSISSKYTIEGEQLKLSSI